MRALLPVAAAVFVAGGCGVTTPSPVSVGCAASETTANLYQPIFSRPFQGPSRVGNHFDHDLPLPDAPNGYVLTLCGDRDKSQVDGHDGYDYQMPEGTQL